MNLLDIRNLSIELKTSEGNILAVDRVSLSIKEGEIKGLVGESGSGKSLLAQAIIGVLDDRWIVHADRFNWRNQDLMILSPEQRKQIITQDVGMIFQEPRSCLDPTKTVGEQLEESIPKSQLSTKFWHHSKERKSLVVQLLHKVGIKQHSMCCSSYPHELTESFCQRIMIAMAIARRPMLLIADEPTAAMESTNQGQIFRLLASLNQLKNMSILLISHDLENITHWTHTITVMYSGQFVEAGTTQDILEQPFHPYTQALIDSSPKSNMNMLPKSQLTALSGVIPLLQHLPKGCRLGPRCPNAQKECVQAPKTKNYHGHLVSCHFANNLNKKQSS